MLQYTRQRNLFSNIGTCTICLHAKVNNSDMLAFDTAHERSYETLDHYLKILVYFQEVYFVVNKFKRLRKVYIGVNLHAMPSILNKFMQFVHLHLTNCSASIGQTDKPDHSCYVTFCAIILLLIHQFMCFEQFFFSRFWTTFFFSTQKKVRECIWRLFT